MTAIKKKILSNICYTELVYERINKKMNCYLSKNEAEELIDKVVKGATESDIKTEGKNFYLTSLKHGIRVTINSNTFRVITVDRLE